MPKLDEKTQQSAERIGLRLLDEVAAINADAGLSASGKQISAAKAYLRAKQDMGQLRDEWTNRANSAIESGERALFGASSISGADAISARDAADRAEQLTTPGEALKLYRRAAQTGDDHLARAVARRAHASADEFGGEGWLEVLQAHAERTPGFEQRYSQIQEAAGGDPFQATLTFALSKPTHLSGIPDFQLEDLARQSETAATS